MRPAHWRPNIPALAIALLGMPAVGLASGPVARPTAQAACAAFDLHLVMELEEAAAGAAVEPEGLLAVVEAMLSARRACRQGDVSEALRTYRAVDLASARTRWLR